MTIYKILRDDRLNRKGEATLYIRITKNRKSTLASTGIKIDPKYWNKQKEVVKSNHPNALQLNMQIRKFEIDFRNQVYIQENKNLASSAKVIVKNSWWRLQ